MKRRKGWRMSNAHSYSHSKAHFPTIPSLHLRHSSFSNPSAASSTPQLILQPFRRFIYATAHSPTLPPLHLRYSSFYNCSVASPMSYALHLRQSSFCNPSAASSTPQLILQPFRRFTYVTGTSRTSPGIEGCGVTKFRSSYSC